MAEEPRRTRAQILEELEKCRSRVAELEALCGQPVSGSESETAAFVDSPSRPVARPGSPGARREITHHAADPGEDPARILAVDDEPLALQVLAAHLSSEKRQVTQACNGAEALDAVEQAAAAAAPFDLVLLDVMMPGMSGYEVCRRLRQAYSPDMLPVILLTAKDRVEDVVEGLEAGANDYLAKPFSKDELLARMHTQLTLRRLAIQRERNEATTRERETMIRALLDATTDAVVLLDRDGTILDLNEACALRFNRNRGEMPGHQVWRYLPDSTAKRRRESIMQVFETGRSVRDEDARDGIWDDCGIFPIWNDSGIVDKVAVFTRDITERKRIEQGLRENEELLSQALEVANAAVWTWDLNTDRITVDERFRGFLGYQKDELPKTSKDFEAMHHPHEWEEMHAAVNAHLRGETPLYVHEHRLLKENGKWMWIGTRAKVVSRNEDGSPRLVLGAAIDITERRTAEESLREAEERYRTVAEKTGQLVYDYNPATGAISWLGAVELITGYTAEEFREVDIVRWTAMVHPSDRDATVSLLDKAMNECGTYDVEYRFRRKNGTYMDIEEHGVFLPDERGRAYRMLGTMSDVTARRKAEAASQAAQRKLIERQQHEKKLVEDELAKTRDRLIRTTRLATLGQLAGSVAHELRNPLGAVRNAAYFLRGEVGGGRPDLSEHLRIIECEINTADGIIRDLLEMSRGSEPLAAEIELDGVVKTAWDRANVPNAVEQRLDLECRPFLVLADPAHLGQALANLFRNARQAIAETGIISVAATHGTRYDEITVRDTGEGVAPEIRDRVFEPLFSTKAKGTGLGLAICRQIIERHGGTLDLVDTEGPGASFRIRLPRKDQSGGLDSV